MKKTNPHFILNKYFGYKSFRPGQLKIINNILDKKDSLSILPTGGGKSICFQIPGLIFSGITLVISPLVSLMKDQVDNLNSKDIRSCYLSGLLSKSQTNTTYDLIKLNKFKFIYIAPERLKSKRFIKVISKIYISLIVIDEAHCISQWGDSFRPIYKQITNLTKQFINCPIAAFTATANKKVQTDICNSLNLINPYIYYQSFKRTNLDIEIINCHNQTIKNISLIRIIKEHQNEIGIIYCSTRKTTKKLHDFLNLFNIDSSFYHAGLDKEKKQNIQVSFSTGHKKLIIATNAFGMGIDVSNIRYVIHYQIPSNIENYYQEIGRAGRDNQPSYCYALYSKNDEKIQYQLLKTNKEKIEDFESLKLIFKSNQCRTKGILKYFGEKSIDCKNCDYCKKIRYKSQLMIHISNHEIEFLRKLLVIKKNNLNLSRKFPITDTLLIYIALINPRDIKQFISIPGIGLGFINVWYTPIQQILA